MSESKNKAKSLKINSIWASIFGIFTFLIWNLIVGILLCVRNDQYKNSGLAICTGIFHIIFPVIIVTLVLSCCLKPKDLESNNKVNTNQNI